MRLGRSYTNSTLRPPRVVAPPPPPTQGQQTVAAFYQAAVRTRSGFKQRFPLQGWSGDLTVHSGAATEFDKNSAGALNRLLGPRPPTVVARVPGLRQQTAFVCDQPVFNRRLTERRLFPLQGYDGALTRVSALSDGGTQTMPLRQRLLGPRPPQQVTPLPTQRSQTLLVALAAQDRVRTERRRFPKQWCEPSETHTTGSQPSTLWLVERALGADPPQLVLPLPTQRAQTVAVTLAAVKTRLTRQRFPPQWYEASETRDSSGGVYPLSERALGPDPPQLVNPPPPPPTQGQQTVAVSPFAVGYRRQRRVPLLPGWGGNTIVETGGIGSIGPGSLGGVALNFGQLGNEQAAVKFTVGQNLTVTSVTSRIRKSGAPTDNAIVSIQADAAGVPSGVALASSASVSGPSLSTTFAAVQLALSLGLTPGDYWVVWSRDGGLDGTNRYVLDSCSVDSCVDWPRGNLNAGTWQIQAASNAHPVFFGLETSGDQLGSVVRFLGPRPPTVIGPPLAAPTQGQQTVKAAVARIRPRPTRTVLSPPATLTAARQVFAGPLVSLTRIRPRPTVHAVAAPTVVRVPAVEQQEQTTRVVLAGRTRSGLARRAPRSVLAPPPALLQTFAGPAVTTVKTRPRPTTHRQVAPTTLAQSTPSPLRVTLAAQSRRSTEARRFPLQGWEQILAASVASAGVSWLGTINSGQTFSSPETATGAFSVPPGATLLAFALGSWTSTPAVSVSDGTNTYVGSQPDVANVPNCWRIDVPSGLSAGWTWTNTNPGNAFDRWIIVALTGVGVYDKGVATTDPVTATPWVTGSLTPSQNGSLLVAFVDCASNGGGNTATAPAIDISTGSNIYQFAEYAVQAGAAPITLAGTSGNAPAKNSIYLLAFKPLPSGTPSSTVLCQRFIGPRPPQVLSPAAPPTQQQQTLARSLAASPRQGRLPHSRLSPPPTVTPTARVFSGPAVHLARNPKPRTISVLRRPLIPPLAQPITAKLAPQRRGHARSILSPPAVGAVFRPVETEIAVQITRASRVERQPHSRLSPPTVVQGPPVDTTIAVSLGSLRAAQRRRASYILFPGVSESQLRPPDRRLAVQTNCLTAAVRAAQRRRTTHFLTAVSYPATSVIGVHLARTRPRPTRHFLTAVSYPQTSAIVEAEVFVKTVVDDRQRRRTRSFLTAVSYPATSEITVTLARARPRPTRHTLAPPVVYPATSEITVTLARTRPRPTTRRLSPPTALQVFAGPSVTKVATRPRPTLVAQVVPATLEPESVELAEQTVRVTLVRSRPRPTHARLQPPTVVLVPSVQQRQQTVAVELVRTRPRPTRYRLAPPTVVAPQPSQRAQTVTVWLAGRTRAEAPRRAPQSRLRPPTVITINAPVVTTITVERVEPRNRRDWQRRFPLQGQRQRLVRETGSTVTYQQRDPLLGPRPPQIIDPLPTQQAQTVSVSLVAVRTRVEQVRHRARYRLTAVSYPQTGRIGSVLAGRTRAEAGRRAPHSRLRPPTVLRVFVGASVSTVSTSTPAARLARQARSFLRPVLVTAFDQRGQKITVSLVRTRPRPTLGTAVRPPTALRTFAGPVEAEVAVRIPVEDKRRQARSRLSAPVVVRVPAVEQAQDTIRVVLAGRTRAEAQRRAPRAHLGPPTVVVSTTARVATTTTRLDLRRRLPHSRLAPPTALAASSARVAVSLTRPDLRRRAPHSRLPAVVVRAPVETRVSVSLVSTRPPSRFWRLAPPAVVTPFVASTPATYCVADAVVTEYEIGFGVVTCYSVNEEPVSVATYTIDGVVKVCMVISEASVTAYTISD